MQKSVNTTGLKLLAFKSSTCKVSPGLASGNSDFRRVSTIHCTLAVCTHNMVHAERRLSFWELGILVSAWQSVPMWPAPTESFGLWASNELPWLRTFRMCCHSSLTGETECHVGPHWKRSVESLCVLSSEPHPKHPFSLSLFCFVSFHCNKS